MTQPARTSALYYSESGAVPPAGPMAGLLFGGAVAIVGGVVYGYADHYIRFIYIEAIMTFAFGALLGWATAKPMVAAKVRNKSSIVLFTIVTSIIGYYVAWIAWLCALSGEVNAQFPIERALMSPPFLWRVIHRLNDVGVWTLSGSPVTGLALWFVWFLEMAIIFLTAIGVARSIAKKRPFCETCGKWTSGPRTILSTATVNPGDLKQRLEAHQFDFVPQLPVYSGTTAEYLDWNAYKCEACREFNTLSVVRTTVTRDRRGRTQKKKKTLVENLLITTPELDGLQVRPAVATAVASPPPPQIPVPVIGAPATQVTTPTIAPAPPLAAPSIPEPKLRAEPPPHDGKLLDL
jgi:hypothetical protein